MEKRWFSVAEASAYFGYKTVTFYSLIARGLLPEGSVLRLGRGIRISIKKIEQEGTLNASARR